MIIPQVVLAVGAAALLTGCAAGGAASTSTPPDTASYYSDAPVSSPVVTVLASRTATGGLCVSGSTCESSFTVSSDGTWELASGDEVRSGALTPQSLNAVLAATTATRIADAPPFTGTCPIAYDGQELVYTWIDASGSTQTVSACQKEVADDDPLVVALDHAQAEALNQPDIDFDAQAARTQAVANAVLGMPEDEAIATIEGVSSMKLTARIVRRDAQTFLVTEDYSPTRVNLSIHAGIVTDATVG